VIILAKLRSLLEVPLLLVWGADGRRKDTMQAQLDVLLCHGLSEQICCSMWVDSIMNGASHAGGSCSLSTSSTFERIAMLLVDSALGFAVESAGCSLDRRGSLSFGGGGMRVG
jgi:hypothetical protein